MSRPAIGMRTHSSSPNRVVEWPDGTVAIGINRKSRGLYVAVMVLPDGTAADRSGHDQLSGHAGHQHEDRGDHDHEVGGLRSPDIRDSQPTGQSVDRLPPMTGRAI